ncbi:MAG: amidohydrolase family protein [Candidatus Aminicenantia bacterium]
MKFRILKFFLIGFFSICLIHHFLYPQDELYRTWAIKDCKIIVSAGSKIEKGTIIIRDGFIENVGVNIPVPPDAEIIDGSKLIAYPGFIDILGKSLLKFPQERTEQTRIPQPEPSEKERGITPEIKAYNYAEINKANIDKFHSYGFTVVQLLPERGILTGFGSVFLLTDSGKDKALLLPDSSLGIRFSPARSGYPNSLMGVVAFLKQTFTDTIYFDMHMRRWEKDMTNLKRPLYDPKLELLKSYIVERKPVVFLCRNQHDILRAIRLGEEFNLNYYICDLGSEAFRVIEEIKKSNSKLILTAGYKVPPTSIYSRLGKEEKERAENELYPKNPAKVFEAEILFAFSSFETDDPSKFFEGIRKAIENGLPENAALNAITKVPADFLNLSKALGTLEPGKIANIVLSEGSIFSKDSKIRYVFVEGKRFEIKEKKVEEGKVPQVNATGKWEISLESPMGTMQFNLDLSQEGNSLSGKFISQYGTSEFSGGKVSGNEIFFTLSFTFGGQSLDLTFSAVIEGDTMSGTVQSQMGSMELKGKRIP